MVWLDKILGPDDSFSLEARTLNAIFFSSAIFGCIATLSDIFISSNPIFILLSSSVMAIMLCLFFISRKLRLHKYLIVPYFMTFIAGILALWFFTGGVTGPISMYFIVLLFVTPIFIHGNFRYVALVSLVILFAVVLTIEINIPNIVVPYESAEIARIDMFTNGIFLAVIASIVMILVLYSYEKQKKKAEALSKTKDKFYSIISHDLRGPMASLLKLGQMLLEQHNDLDPNYRQQFIKHIYDSSMETHTLLENLLHWARTEAEEIPVNPESIHLLKCIDHTSKVLIESIRQKQINLDINIADNHFVYADENMLMTVVRNLLSNAVKYTMDGGRITVSSSLADNKKVHLTISDNGVGIEQDRQMNIFDKIHSTSTKGTNHEIGTGLGLNLCREFIKKNNGEIFLESEADKGTSFIVSLPTSPN